MHFLLFDPMDAKDLLTRWSNQNYWQKLCPDLTISTATSNHRGSAEEKYEPSERKELLQRIIDDGYALINATCCNSSMRAKIADAISDLETKHNLPATFILLFDETWHLASQSNHLLLPQNQTEGILRSHGKMSFNFDMLAWHIDPCKNQAGFSPHRDRQPDTTDALNQSFYPDGQAKYITHWIALADATPNNSCLCESVCCFVAFLLRFKLTSEHYHSFTIRLEQMSFQSNLIPGT